LVLQRAQTEAVTFLGNQDSSRSLYAIPGLDYVAHEDIIPYTSAEKSPLHHELFDKFLAYDPDKGDLWEIRKFFSVGRGRHERKPCQLKSLFFQNTNYSVWLCNQQYTPVTRHIFVLDPPFVPQETLRAWQNKNHPWLELSDVHKETTENIRVTVIPFYMGFRESHSTSVYWWRYCIRLENLGSLSVQLRERHWRIFSLSGTLETVRGRGVVGQEPALTRTLPAFQYSSHVSLQAPSGHMGTFRMEREDGYTFDCRIPPFSLESKPDITPAAPPGAL
jgi:polymerase delta-interacting protein 2